MMSGAVQTGRQQKLYYNNRPDSKSAGAGTYLAPVWVIIDRIGDLDFSNSKASTDVDMRASETTIKVFGNKTRSITFTYYRKGGAGADPVFDVLSDSYENDKPLDMAMLDGLVATSGSTGVRGPFTVAQLDKSEPIAGVVSYAVTLEFSDFEHTPGTTQLFEPEFTIP